MQKLERALVMLAVLALGMAFVFPLWQIDIWAPQYPEGLKMVIWLDRISGNINQINILNHYIGMKHITPSSIPELRIMPWAVVGLMGTGTLAAWINRRWAVGVWLATFVAAGLVGLYDFYAWGYDYGHNLSPDAPIKVPGMSYQPPLLGHKLILNIDAFSMPHLGGVAVGVAAGLGGLALFGKHVPWSRLKALLRNWAAAAWVVLGTALVASSGCTPKPVPIRLGVDSCDSCRMTVSDGRFGGEIITKKGKAHKFDSLECLLRYRESNAENVKEVMVADFLRPGELVRAEEAVFLRSDKINGPMGHGVVGSRDQGGMESLQTKFKGELLDWKSVARPASPSS